jgi:hypothetical protein
MNHTLSFGNAAPRSLPGQMRFSAQLNTGIVPTRDGAYIDYSLYIARVESVRDFMRASA